MERKEAAVYLYVGVLILGAIVSVYFFNMQLTGFAIFEQQNQTDFSGDYANTFYNGSAIVLNESFISGTYTSNILDANSSLKWDNLSWQGIVPENTSFSLQVKSCSVSNCSDSAFTNASTVGNLADLSSLNLTGRYFQYKFTFSGFNLSSNSTNNTYLLISPSLNSVKISSSSTSSPASVSVNISEPSETKTSRLNIPIKFTSTGEGLQCKYNVKDSSGGEVIGNTTLSGCGNSTFNLNADGDYVFTLYVNGYSGFASQISTFLISTASTSSNSANQEEPPAEELPPVTVPEEPVPEAEAQSTTELSLQDIEASTMNPSDSKNFNLIAQNTGTNPVSACKLNSGGDFASWISLSDNTQNMNSGEQKTFAFSLNVPADASERVYTFPLSVQCAEISKDSEFSVNVVKKRFIFNLTGVERTRADTVSVSYSLQELLNEKQSIDMKFLFYDSNNQQVANASLIQNLSAGQEDEFTANVPINESLKGNLTLAVNLNSQQYTSTIREPIVLGSPTGFFVFGDNLGTTGNVLAIVILLAVVAGVVFFLRRKKS